VEKETEEAKSPQGQEKGIKERSEIPEEAKKMAMLCHLLGMVGILGPLAVWVLTKDKHQFVYEQGKEALNFQLTVLICLAILIGILVGIPLIPALVVLNVIFVVIAGVKAGSGEAYRYPVAFRLLK
jgi:uncharacterized Tic20 family protein